MAIARLLDQPDDYKRLGVNPDKVEVWEDRRRDDARPNHWEWWYFDAILDDGTTVVIQFFTKSGMHLKENGDHPSFHIKVTLPDGTLYSESPTFRAKEASYGEDQCNVRFGSNIFKGDLREYVIHVETTKGIGADLKLTSLSKSYRPGTAYFNFGSEEKYYTWLCAVPKGEVTGTLTVGGKTTEVHGFGYHDHQWGNVNFLTEWNHWLWARQSFDDYSMLVFDMVSNKNTEYSRFPIMFIQDKDGNIVFENTHNVTCEVLEEYHDDEASGKDYPKALHYSFENDGKQVDYTLKVKKVLENTGIKNLPAARKLVIGFLGISPSYTRYLASGELVFKNGDEAINRSGELIYEFMFPGNSYKGHI